MQFIGQKENLDMIDKWADLPPFMIIQGDEHMGKEYFVLYLCKKYNLRYFKVKNSVKDVRELINHMVPNSRTIFHLDDFDKASLAAKNALLKITEEPVYGNYIIITGGPQLKTLESRAKRILMAPYSKEEVSEYMKPYFPDPLVQSAIYDAGINSPAKVDYYKDYEKLQGLVSYAEDVSRNITSITGAFCIEMLDRFANYYFEGIDPCLLFLNIIINILETKLKKQAFYSYDKILITLIKGKRSLLKQPTLKRKMLLFDMFYTIHKLNEIDKLNGVK